MCDECWEGPFTCRDCDQKADTFMRMYTECSRTEIAFCEEHEALERRRSAARWN